MMAKDILISIENEVAKHQEHLIQVRSLIIDQSISNYPIFVFQKPSQAILGSKIIDAAMSTDRWSIFITHLEELYHKKIILEEKLADFQFQYKNNNDKYCILLIENVDEYSFIFTPMEI
jgi:hypothetical protein